MNQSKLKQYRYDIEMWKRALLNAQQENAILKTRLAEFSTTLQGKKYIDLLEYQQNSLISIDNIFSIFRNDIYHYNLSIEKEISIAEDQPELKLSQHQKMSNEIEVIEYTFNKSKFQFINFINEILTKKNEAN